MKLLHNICLKFPTILLVLFQSTAFSQTTAQLSRLVPPSPTAAALGKYGDVPVSYYSGIANLNIPLHTIKTQNHELDISLQYSTTGLKPGEEASWAGLGWSLNAGGVITRVVRGLDDFKGSQGYRTGGQCLPASDGNNNYAAGSVSPQLDLEKFLWMSGGTMDGEPDIFYYNFGQQAGKFVLDKLPSNCSSSTGAVFMAQRNNLDIVFDNSSNNYPTSSKWVITDGNGFKYTFSQQETTVNCSQVTSLDVNGSTQPIWDDDFENQIGQYTLVRPPAPSPNRYDIWGATMQNSDNQQGVVTSWYLTSIVSPEGETVTFTYKSNPYTGQIFYTNTMAGAVSSIISTSDEHYKQTQGSSCLGTFGLVANRQHSFQNHYLAYLDKIQFNGGSIVFNNTTINSDIYRDDLLYSNSPSFDCRPRKLRNIEVLNDKGGLVKRFVLSYGYFNNGYTPSDDQLRLRLDNVVEYGSDGSTGKKPYQFTYNSQNDVLPSKTTLGLDGWGYSNGYNSNSTLLHDWEYTDAGGWKNRFFGRTSNPCERYVLFVGRDTERGYISHWGQDYVQL